MHFAYVVPVVASSSFRFLSLYIQLAEKGIYLFPKVSNFLNHIDYSCDVASFGMI